jgi:tetratricopeptide (TPR) repeat protein
MPETQTSDPIPVDDPASPTGTAPLPEEAEEAAPAPEPMTPERVSQWNAYYDVYVKWAALIFVFMVACNYVTDSNVWLHLKTGQLIAKQSLPVTTDVFSYTEAGQPWFNVPWLFQWSHAVLYDFSYGLVPVDTIDPTANRARAEQISIGALVVFDALIRFLTALVILRFRHRGPGTWWSAVCLTLTLGVIYHPIVGILMGGISGPSFVMPGTWGLFFLALELWMLFRAFFQGRAFGLWLLLPIFLLWANVDVSFLLGLVVLAAAAVGYVLDRGRMDVLLERPGEDGDVDPKGRLAVARPVGSNLPLVITALCALLCLANPSTWHAFDVAASPFYRLFQNSFFNPALQKQPGLGEDWYLLPAYYLAIVALGLGSFLLNVRRFSWARFLPFAVTAAIWGSMMHENGVFALVLAWVAAPNGQEWYQDRFGVQGRMGARWAVWSTGGRLVTLALIFLFMSKDITGWGNPSPDIQFGLGFHPDAFTLAAADFLDRHNEITGNILNTSTHQGDLMIWKSAPKRKTYLDGRPRLFPRELQDQWNKTRKALSEDDVAGWKPLLDKYDISAFMIEPTDSPITYVKLMQSPNWIPFYDDGRIVMFGRADAPATDLAFFKANQLDADLRAYRTTHMVAGAERPPNPTTWIDGVFQNRTYSRPQSRVDSAQRWLHGPLQEAEQAALQQQPWIPDPAHCILAIQEARTALANSPDDWLAFRTLKDAYRHLMIQENAMLFGVPITRENTDRILRLEPKIELLMTRMQQRAAALNYAIQTTPPPKTSAERVELGGLNLELAQIYFQLGARDLSRDRLKAFLEGGDPKDYSKEMFTQYQQQFAQLDESVKKVEESVSNFEIEHSAGPVDRASVALNQGNTGQAIAELAEAERNLVSTAVVKPRLVDLYCNTGQPDKAVDLLATGALEDPNLGVEPGSGAFRQGRVYHLLGNYMSAATLWHERAIPRVRAERSGRILAAAAGFTRGDALQTTNVYLGLPTSLNQQAAWLYDLGMCQLEAGMPIDAGESFSKALTLSPALGVRPIAAYYLQKMGQTIQPPMKPIQARDAPGRAPADSLKAGILPSSTTVPPARPATPSADRPTAAPSESGKEKPAASAPSSAGAAATKKGGP